MQWTVGRHRGEAKWDELGTAQGSNPQAALEAWIDEEGGVDAGGYGVREPGTEEWRYLFLVGRGAVRSVGVLH